MSGELIEVWYVVYDYVLYDFKTNFRITKEHPDGGIINNNATYGQFTTKKSAINYINDTIEHQIKILNMVIKAIPQQKYEG